MKTHLMMRKSVALVIASATLLAIAGCGRTTESGGTEGGASSTIDSKPATGTVTIWAMGNEGDKLSSFVSGFEKENPDVTVKVTAIPWSSAHDKLQTAIAAGNAPDVAQMGTTWMADFAGSFSEVPSNLGLSDFSDGPLKAGQVKGKQLGVPWYVDTHVLFYRKDIAEKAGWNRAPKTWTELKSMAAAMQKVEGVDYGFYIAPSGTDCFLGNLDSVYSSGGILLKDGKWNFDSAQVKKGFELTTSLFKDGIADANADVSSGASIANFASGKTAMMIAGPTTISQLSDLDKNIASKYATAVLPTAKTSTAFVGGADFVVFKDSKNKQAAWKFVKWASQPKIQAQWYQLTSDLPASSSAWKESALSGDDKLSAFGEQLKSTMAPPAVTTWAQVTGAADQIVEQMNKGTLSVSQGMEQLQKQAESIGTGE
ncbi:MAG: extracellular solute-binding protein [Bifidobacterium sp.]|uniref:Extracellular solute-binding protein n=1 Tax=Bifidobacterium fermentum TaxID=3059035 RepID=A0AB39UND4_9BIFI